LRLDGNADDREDGPNGKARGERQCAHAQNLIGPLAGYLLHLKALSKNAVRARAPPRVRPFCMAVFSAAQPVYPSGRGLCFHAQAPCKKKPLADPHMNVKACQRRCWMSGPFIRPRWTVGSRSVPVYQQGMCQASARCFPPSVLRTALLHNPPKLQAGCAFLVQCVAHISRPAPFSIGRQTRTICETAEPGSAMKDCWQLISALHFRSASNLQSSHHFL